MKPTHPDEGLGGLRPPESKADREKRTAVLLFVATLISVYLVYGFQWTPGNPITDLSTAWESAQFSVGLMAILLAHEMGHYIVAKRHGFELSLPYFIPFPAAFGTFGAIIRLRSLPKSRTALLEMGAAGPLAGFLVALVAIVLGLPGTEPQSLAEITAQFSGLQLPPPPAPEPGTAAHLLERILSSPPMSWIFPPFDPDSVPLMILANPPVMDMLGIALQGGAPGRYDILDPLAMAGWVGCLLTAINLVPIGQLDGGHIFNALFPERARLVSRLGVGVAIVAGVAWAGWAFWGVLLLALGAWMSLEVPKQPGLTKRARWIAVLAGIAFLLTFMPRPVELENVKIRDVSDTEAP